MRMRYVAIGAILWVALGWGRGRAASLSPALLNQVNAYFSAIETLSASYTQETITRAVGGPQPITLKELSSGKVYFRRPAFFRMEQVEPQPELVVSNEKYTWWLIPSENKVYRYSAQSRSGTVNAWTALLSGGKRLQDVFHIRLVEENRTTYLLSLTPLQADKEIQRIEVRLKKDGNHLVSLRIVYTLGQEVLYTLTQVQENVSLPDRFFEFSPSPGVRVIRNP